MKETFSGSSFSTLEIGKMSSERARKAEFCFRQNDICGMKKVLDTFNSPVRDTERN